ncbi:aldehyde dehydrogenase [Curtanaerobium respiraculi]|uniref:aldehyde dehydrogenase n=1 Tax=Curtanaerobium respiraculi TaxID=2949669 RepID=UPI0024B36274|nr:aldehyde dehydrogenase [Curtanaerobium respiraculi]
MDAKHIAELVKRQRAFFESRLTFDVTYRVQALERLRRSVIEHEGDICDALKKDLGKSASESYIGELGLSRDEIRHQIAHVRGWSKPRTVPTHLANFAAKSFTVQEPYGIVLIMAPWNYPFLLTLEPLAGALAAGNCVVLKPSAYAPASSAVLRDIVEECFDPNYVAIVEGGRAENTALLETEFDRIFFTGSVGVGKLVMEKAAAHLTPVSLELGGKSPAVVDAKCNLRVSASRIAFGKYLNLGQTCVAPDYALVDQRIHDRFVEALNSEITAMYGANAFANPDYGRIVNRKHYDRIMGLIDASRDKVVRGGTGNPDTLQIEPTVMDGVTPDDPIMGEEIFGPVLPILAYDGFDEAEAFVRERPKPLAGYLFTEDRALQERWLAYTSFGGGCINDTIVHLATPEMGFGGVGASGMGSYHGKKSFETFSHEKSIMKKYTWIDMPMRNQPYRPLNIKIIRMLLH